MMKQFQNSATPVPFAWVFIRKKNLIPIILVILPVILSGQIVDSKKGSAGTAIKRKAPVKKNMVSTTLNAEPAHLSSENKGNATAVPTFENVSLYWIVPGANENMICNVQYKLSSGSEWKDGYPFVFDIRVHNAADVPNYTNGVVRPANEYRGSIVGLKSETKYDYKLTAGDNTYTGSFTTWTETEHLTIASTTVLRSSTTISISGTPAAWRVYEGNINGGKNNIVVNASYIIIRNMTLKAAGEDAILLKENAHDVRIEYNDISGWGYVGMGSNNQSGVRVKGLSGAGSSGSMKGVQRIVVQRNKIHDSRETTNYGWDAGGRHPDGPNGINFEEAGGNNVIRYNEIYGSDNKHYFMDGIGGADNFTKGGFPRENSDIYGNKISHAWDDGIEAEGANCNVRVYGNYIDTSFVAIGIATTSIGPVYIFRNVYNHSRRLSGWDCATADGEDRGGFIKAGTQVANTRGGAAFVFNNTLLQPDGCTFPFGAGYGIQDAAGGPFSNLTSRNNIFYIWKITRPAIGLFNGEGEGNSFDYDLYNGTLKNTGFQESNGIRAVPTFTGNYFLSVTSEGVDKGIQLNNFTDGYRGSAPDMGAHEIGTPGLEFGVKAYKK